MSKNEKTNNIGTSDMPHPSTIVYDTKYAATGNFLKDLEKSLADMPYIDACKYFDILAAHDNVLTTAVLNEYLSLLGGIPFKYIAGIMSVLRNPETFANYFVELEETPQNNQ